MVNELTIGSVGISLILTVFLRMVYNTWEVPKRFKPWIAIAIGMCLATISLVITNDVLTKILVASYLVQGFMTGATAVGLNEIIKPQNQPPKATGSGSGPG